MRIRNNKISSHLLRLEIHYYEIKSRYYEDLKKKSR